MNQTEQQPDREPRQPWVTPAIDVIALKDALAGNQGGVPDGSVAGYS